MLYISDTDTVLRSEIPQLLFELDRPASLASLSARALSTSALGGSSLRCCCADRGTRGMSGSFSLQSAPS